jgi:hypothetical protein
VDKFSLSHAPQVPARAGLLDQSQQTPSMPASQDGGQEARARTSTRATWERSRARGAAGAALDVQARRSTRKPGPPWRRSKF